MFVLFVICGRLFNILICLLRTQDGRNHINQDVPSPYRPATSPMATGLDKREGTSSPLSQRAKRSYREEDVENFPPQKKVKFSFHDDKVYKPDSFCLFIFVCSFVHH